MPLPEQTPRAPTPFGPYLLDAPIAEGGMARVYRARLRGALGFEKPLVVKQVRPELARDPRFVEMFAREAKALVRLVHPHIVPIYELGVVDGVYFIAMEHIEGATLEGVLAEGPLDPGPAAHLGVQVAEALHHAHERHSLVHRDVTPRNVMVDEGGHARLLDFGIATPAEGTDGEVFGTPGYLSPEQARGDDVGPKSDVFSLGCVLARALTGDPPFDGDTGRERMLAGRKPAMDGVPEALRALLERMLAADPADRPDAAAVARALRSWLAGAHPEGAAQATAERASRAREQGSEVVTTGESTAAVGKVRTLATSPVLDGARPTRSVEAGPRSDDATMPIEGRRGRDSATETEAKSEAKSESASGPETESASGSRSESASESEAGPRPMAAPRAPGIRIAVGLAVVVAVVLGSWTLWRASEPPPEEMPVSPTLPPVPYEPEPEAEVEVEPVAEEGETELGPAVGEREDEVEGAAEAAEPPVVEAAPQRGTLRVSASPWAEVSLDGRPLGTTPVRGARVPPGAHRLVFDCPPLGVRLEREVRIDAGADVAVFADLSHDPPRVTVR